MTQDKLPIIVMGAAGRMGNLIANLVKADERFELAGAVDHAAKLTELKQFGCPLRDSLAPLLKDGFAGVIIDFTAPAVSLATAQAASSAGAAAVIGTTGLDKSQQAELAELARETRLLWSANMSIGVNVLERLLPRLASALGPQYDLELLEIHHKNKKDAPSGTALNLARGMAESRGWELDEARVSCRDGLTGPRKEKELGVMAIRGGDVVGIHTAYFLGQGEIIEVRHQAESRENFACGAMRAALWLARQKPGRLYSMQDVIARDD